MHFVLTITEPPNNDNWNLSGNTNNMFTPEEWNNFQRKQLQDINAELEQRETLNKRIDRDCGLDCGKGEDSK